MALSVQTNAASLTAQANLSRSSSRLNVSLERLSTGLKINKAADDASGLVISEKQRAQITGLEQGIANIDRAVNMVQTAESGLDQINGFLLNLRQLAVDSSNNGALDANALAANQAEVDNLLTSIDRVAGTTKFGTQNLLDGKAGLEANSSDTTAVEILGAKGSLSAGPYTINVTTAATKANIEATAQFGGQAQATGTLTLGVGITLTVTALAGGAADGTAGNAITVTRTQAVAATTAAYNAATNTITVTGDFGAGVTMAQMGTAINAITDANGDAIFTTSGAAGNASAGSTANVTSGGVDGALAQDENLTVNGVSIALTQGMSQAQAMAKINEYSSQTGVSAVDSTTNPNQVLLVANEWGTSGNFSVYSDVLDTADGTGFGTTTLSDTGSDIVGDINGEAATIGKGNTLSFGGLSVAVQADSSSQTESQSGAGLADVSVNDYSRKFQIGAFAAETASITINSAKTTALGQGVTDASFTSLSSIKIGTFDNAQDAIKVIDQAITDVAGMRGTLGAFQKNTLGATQSNLRAQLQNMQEAEAGLRDTDFATEIAKFTNEQIRSQAATSVLGLANQNAQGILSLLQG